MVIPYQYHKGRGAVSNADSRFEPYVHEAENDGWDIPEDETSSPKTKVIVDNSKTILAFNQSPDIPFNQSINPYRGCEHGCVYCYARPTHAYLGLSPGLDFETRILIKPNAAKLLRKQLLKPGYSCSPIALGTNTDPYQPLERKLKITRTIIEVLAECNHPFTIVTKSALVLRDIDIIAPMAAKNLCRVFLSIPTMDNDLSRLLEPRTAAPSRRLSALEKLHANGVETGVMVAPIIPLLTDGELETIIATAAKAGAGSAGYVLLRLPHEVKTLFNEWLSTHYPLKLKHIMGLVKQTRGGKEYNAVFGERMRGTGHYAGLIKQRFATAVKKSSLDKQILPLDGSQFSPRLLDRQAGSQLSLF